MNEENRSGFSLVELLTAVLIIAVLAGFLLPAINAIREAAYRKKAHSDVLAMEHAIQAYRSMYGVWPRQASGTADRVVDDPVEIAAIIAALTNNPRDEIFIEFDTTIMSNGCPLDPWMRPYVIAMDDQNDGDVELTASIDGVTLTTNLRAGVIVFSWGRFPEDEKRRPCSWVN